MEEQEWIYVDEYRRRRGNIHQLYIEGEWVTINTNMGNIIKD